MAEDKIFADGLLFKSPRDGAPDFVLGSISIKVEEFIPFLEKHVKTDGWVNLDVLVSRAGKPYAALNTYKRDDRTSKPPDRNNEQEQQEMEDAERNGGIDWPKNDINPDDIPF